MPYILKGLPKYHQLVGTWPKTGPAYLLMNLPTTCSLHCPKCAINKTPRVAADLSDAERAEVLAAAKAAGILTLVIIGMGEPTEHPEVMMPTIEAAHNLGLTSIVFSTFNRMTSAQAKFYRNHNTSLIMSIDSKHDETYSKLTGGGDLTRVLLNWYNTKDVYNPYDCRIELLNGGPLIGTIVARLARNTTVCADNVSELLEMKQGLGYPFFANPPMRHGRAESEKGWGYLVDPSRLTRGPVDDSSFGPEWEHLRAEAEKYSDTGGHSSLTDGLCGYFSRGVSVHVDGSFLGPCGYATETVGHYGNVRGCGSEGILAHYNKVRAHYAEFASAIGRRPSCPLRDPALEKLVQIAKK